MKEYKEYKNFKYKQKLEKPYWVYFGKIKYFFRFRYDPVPGIHTDKSITYNLKNPKVTQERRKSFEHPEFIRPKRQNKGLPDPYDDVYIKRPLRNWKRTKKKKQWM